MQPGSVAHPFGAFVMAALRAGFALVGVEEMAPDVALAARLPRAATYVGRLMLVVLSLAVGPRGTEPGAAAAVAIR
jgi:hypothetical protein